MKILILGTSNSVLKYGWTAGLRNALPDAEIVNMSLGDSPGTQFGFNLTMNFRDYDVVFFDSVVNDENMLPAIGDFALLKRVTYEIVSTIAAQTAVIVLGFSNERHFGNHSAAYIARRNLAAICGVQFVGMHDLVEKFGARVLPGHLTLFDASGTHPLAKIQNLFGYALGRMLPRSYQLARATVQPTCYAQNFQAERVTDLAPPGEIITKTNSLTTGSFLELGPDTTIAFRSGGLCLGFYADIRSTQSIIYMDNPSGRRIKEFWYEFDAERFQIKFVPVKNGYPVRSITTVGDNWLPPPGVEIERSSGTMFVRRRPSDAMKLTFGGALFWSGQADAPLPAITQPLPDSMRLHQHLAIAVNALLLTPQAAQPGDGADDAGGVRMAAQAGDEGAG